jgi:hypothetical protein
VFPVVLDTDASSLLLKKRLPITLATKLINAQLVITFVTRAELTKWAEVRNWGVRNRQLLADWMATMHNPAFHGSDRSQSSHFGLASIVIPRQSLPYHTGTSPVVMVGLTSP